MSPRSLWGVWCPSEEYPCPSSPPKELPTGLTVESPVPLKDVPTSHLRPQIHLRDVPAPIEEHPVLLRAVPMPPDPSKAHPCPSERSPRVLTTSLQGCPLPQTKFPKDVPVSLPLPPHNDPPAAEKRRAPRLRRAWPSPAPTAKAPPKGSRRKKSSAAAGSRCLPVRHNAYAIVRWYRSARGAIGGAGRGRERGSMGARRGCWDVGTPGGRTGYAVARSL